MPRKLTMRWSLPPDELLNYTARQLRFFDIRATARIRSAIRPFIRDARMRLEVCFRQIRRKYYVEGEHPVFNHLHGDHYATYLYFLSNVIYRAGSNDELASRVFLLNKALHGCDIFYGVSLPDIFLLIHPVGTVLGNATYGNHLVVYQNCSVGSTESGVYPVFEGQNILFSRSAVLGGCRIGLNSVVAANAFLLDVDIPADSTVVGQYPNHRVLRNQSSVVDRMFRC